MLKTDKTITPEELKAKMEAGENFKPVETLPVEYFRHTHLPGAANLPSGRIQELAPTVVKGFVLLKRSLLFISAFPSFI